MRQRWRFSAVLALLALPGGAAPSSEPDQARAVASTSVAAFPAADAPSASAPVGTAAFPDVPEAPVDPAVALLRSNPYTDELAAMPPGEHELLNPYAAARLANGVGSLEVSPYLLERQLANPYTDEVRMANPYSEDLKLANPYAAMRR